MSTLNLLYKQKYDITPAISIRIPKVREIIECEDEYYGTVFAITAMPVDMMVQLDDIGIDFTKINEYELFLLLFEGIKNAPYINLVFEDLDLKNFQMAVDKSGEIFLVDPNTGVRIDKIAHYHIANALRRIHNLEKKLQKPANEAARKYMIERARIKQKRAKSRSKDSDLEELIIAMVNTSEFKYDYDSVLNMSIYQFNASVNQIIRKINYDNLMIGCYAGTVNVKELSQDSLNWLSNNRRNNQ